MILTGDIGGTKTRLALWENKKLCKEERYASKKYPDLFTIIQDFLQKETVSLQAACFGIAGPVKDQVSHVTNLPWVVDAKSLSKKLQLPHVYLLNDLEANAYGIEFIPSNETIVFQEGEKNEGNRALIAAGTGLGEAGLYWDGKMYKPFACEGGHTDFGPRNEIEIDLLLFLRK
ncbi:MAG: ROK family protein, partial [Chlamydiae bacterium]|nr:ROK family protein [Chlamydiota bacterium]